MALTLPGHSAPAVGFEVPLEMLAACHGRVQHQCETLLRLVTHLQTHGADRPAQEAASAVMRYFDTAARHHHEDEEQDLFPALLESMAGSDAVCLRELTASLCSDHRLLEQRWAVIAPAVVASRRGRRFNAGRRRHTGLRQVVRAAHCPRGSRVAAHGDPLAE